MRVILRILGAFLGLLSNVVGLVGGSDQVAQLSGLLAKAHHYFGNPFIYFAATIGGSALLATSFSDWLLARKLAAAGGVTKKEFPAHFDQWKRLDKFSLWQVAWLWNGHEPQGPSGVPPEGTHSYATFRWLLECLDKNQFTKVVKNGADTNLDRQSLIDFALKQNVRPQFLFGLRQFRIFDFLYGLRHHLVSDAEIQNFMRSADFETGLYRYVREIGQESQYVQIRNNHYRTQFVNGNWQAIGRLITNGLMYEHEAIPRRQWQHYESFFSSLKLGRREYGDVRVRDAKRIVNVSR